MPDPPCPTGPASPDPGAQKQPPGPPERGAPGAEPTPAVARLTGSVARITYQNPENGYAVIKLEPEGPVDPQLLLAGGVVAAVGIMPGVDVGETIELSGEWTRDQKFGWQFRARGYKPRLPTGVRGIEVYLASGAVKGIGPVTAKRIVERFGERTFEVLDGEPARLNEVPKLTRKAAAKIRQAWRVASGDRELVTFLGEYGVSPAIAARLRKTYQENALAVVRANPYRLTTDVRGIGFMRADAIARKIGLAADAPERIDAAIDHVLESAAGEGHTCLPRPRLEELAANLLQLNDLADRGAALVTGRMEDAIAKRRVVMEQIEEEQVAFSPALHDAERRIAEGLKKLMASAKTLPRVEAVAALADFEQRARIGLAQAQREAALTLARRGMMILTGGPGTGKTTTVRAVLELFTMGRLTVKMAAPTGRAARRLAETGKLPAETIHRMLGYQAPLGKFGRDAANPVEADLVIVDEVSMLDAPLAAQLIEALHPRTCLMLVGDEDQLPSVGPGNVLGDLIASGAMPVVRLTEIFRQAQESLIVTNAHRINRGEMPLLTPPPECRNPDFFFIEREDPPAIIDTIKTLIRERIPRKFHLDPHRDVQVLSPMRRGELGVEALNKEIKSLINARRPVMEQTDSRRGDLKVALATPNVSDPANAPATSVASNESENMAGDAESLNAPAADSPAIFDQPGAGAGGWVFPYDIGDRIMQTANNYDKLVFNGDIGMIVHADPKTREVIADFDGRQVSYLSDELDQLTLAYATTIHKSQGSEYPAVIIPIHTQHWIMLQRNLIYTAVTRARKLVCFVGTRRALARAVKNAERARRFTALRHFLRGA